MHRDTDLPNLTQQRLRGQQISVHEHASPRDLVAWLGATQAQDYAGAKWALGLRLAGKNTDSAVERAVAEGTILRTHTMRGTWHFVTREDIRWMIALSAPRYEKSLARRHAELALDAGVFRRCNAVLIKALTNGAHGTRNDLRRVLEESGVVTSEQRLVYLLMRAEVEGLVCSGARAGKQQTYALLDERAPLRGNLPTRDEALAKFAQCYFQSRGPATLDDFRWWSGLIASEARSALAAISSSLRSEVVDGRTYWFRRDTPKITRSKSRKAYLLPPFDEYLVAYIHRDALLDPKYTKRVNAGGGLLRPSVIIDGRVVGTWQRTLGRSAVNVEVELFERPTASDREAILVAARVYGDFLGLETDCVLASPRRRASAPKSRNLKT